MCSKIYALTVPLMFCAFVVNGAKTDYYTSVSGLEELIQTEVVILAELQRYVDTISSHIEALEGEIASIKREHLTASEDLEGYLNNPVNAFRLIKRLHTDWATFEESVEGDHSRANFLVSMQQHRKNFSFPNGDDVLGSAVAMVRLQETYQLDVAQLASGILNGVKYGPAMSWQDCFQLGQLLYDIRDFNHTVPWLRQSMDMLIEQDYNDDPLSLDFMETVAAYHQEMGDFETALKLINHVLAIDAERTRAGEVKLFLQQKLADGVKQGLLHDAVPVQGDYRLTNEYKLYMRVCRSEVTATPTQQRPLRCRYHTNQMAYRLLQPFKMEEHSLDPYVVQVHDVISERDTETLKKLAKPLIERSEVQSTDGVSCSPTSYRTSKTAWFSYDKYPWLHKWLRLVHHMSGLDTTQAEDLQVLNYGIGGHYEPHWDFFSDERSLDERGNRVATCIFYLSDVEEGGGTAFPFLPALVKPERGSALLFFNLHSSEDLDYRTKHAACPVLKGSKWISNVWVPVRQQYRARPCTVRPNLEEFLIYRDYD